MLHPLELGDTMSIKKVPPTDGLGRPDGDKNLPKDDKTKTGKPQIPDIMKQLKELQEAGRELDKMNRGDKEYANNNHVDHDNSHTDHSNHSDNSPCL